MGKPGTDKYRGKVTELIFLKKARLEKIYPFSKREEPPGRKKEKKR